MYRKVNSFKTIDEQVRYLWEDMGECTGFLDDAIDEYEDWVRVSSPLAQEREV